VVAMSWSSSAFAAASNTFWYGMGNSLVVWFKFEGQGGVALEGGGQYKTID